MVLRDWQRDRSSGGSLPSYRMKRCFRSRLMFAFVSAGRNLMSSLGHCTGHSVGSVGAVDVC